VKNKIHIKNIKYSTKSGGGKHAITWTW